MVRTEAIIVFLLIAVATIGGIGTEMGIQSSQAQGHFGPGQNDNSQGNNNNQQAGRCGFHNDQSNCENSHGNQN